MSYLEHPNQHNGVSDLIKNLDWQERKATHKGKASAE